MTTPETDRWIEGLVPLPGRLEPWMQQTLDDHAALSRLIATHGSPVNLIEPRALPVLANQLVEAAALREVGLRIFFARKANKALALVEVALETGHGVDVASQRELEQVLALLPPVGAMPEQVIVTAAVKPRGLLELCVDSGVTVSIDNADELALLQEVASARRRTVDVALRLTPDIPDAEPSRFGQDATAIELLLQSQDPWRRLRLRGFHFHLHGYAAVDRAMALEQALELVEAAREHGHAPEFIDIGGGVPMAYLDDPDGWTEYWQRHQAGDHQTWRNRPLGTVYPVWQRPVRGEWLLDILDHPTPRGTIADRLRQAAVRLHAEPGRAILDGCGLTVARVEFRKQQRDGSWLIGLAMNRTQCRSAADDFLVDPLLVPAPDAERSPAGEGYLVGAYCIEAELLTWRRMRLPGGVAVGDLIVFVNTAGYQMHILESASHQIPLARNLIRQLSGEWQLDSIDLPGASAAR
jgi:diaminopimelate decarboxylase